MITSWMSEGANSVNWPNIIAGMNARAADVLVPEVEAFLKRASQSRILVACSGGADSVFLLLLLMARKNALRIDLVVAHYDHRWRGEASTADADFVESLAQALGLPYVTESRPEHEAAFTETTARALRLEFIRRAASRFQCSCVAFGHQMDDILETQLQRIARGSGSEGLAAPRPIARFAELPTHVRPLLNIRAVDIRMLLNTLGVPWREDDSNEDLSIARNALRNKVIPDLQEALGRDPSLGAARCRRILEEDAFALQQLAEQQLPEAYSKAMCLSRSALRSVPRAITRRALMAWFSTHGILASVGAAAMDLLLDDIFGAKKKHQVSAGASYIVIEADWIRIEMEHGTAGELSQEAEVLDVETSMLLPNGAVLDLALVDLDAWQRDQILSGKVNPAEEVYVAASAKLNLAVRGWIAGDRFKPIGAPGAKKLKDWFVSRQIPQKERKQLPVVINHIGEIIWVPGLPPADQLKIRPTTKRALRLTYRLRNPPSLA